MTRGRQALAAGIAVLLIPAGVLLGVLAAAAGVGVASPPAGCAGAGTGQRVGGVALSAEQVGNAQTIVTVTAGRRLPAYAAVVAVAVAYQESTLHNLTVPVDHDSEGLFQQRISIYTRPVADDPARATGAFLTRLVRVPNWQRLPLTVAAQAVQASAYPDAYARRQVLAENLVGQLWPAAAAGPATLPAAVCPGQGGARPGSNVAGSTRVPAGLVIDGSPAAVTAVRFALAQLGKPYAWGAAGPAAYDCSGLMMAAWAAAGVPLPHFTGAQLGTGTPAAGTAPAAGDLVFIPGADGTAQAPRHVGMAVGVAAGHAYLVHAPTAGLPVEITDLEAWAGQIAAVRHIA